MTFDLRKRLFIIIGIGVSVLLALIFAILFLTDFFANRAPDISGPGNSTVFNTSTSQNTPIFDDVDATTVIGQATVPANPSDRQILLLARDFVERYTSYSNQNDNAHIDEVLSMVTVRMSDWLETQKADNESIYRGVTTRVIASSFDLLEKERAVVAIDVQQEMVYRVDSNVRYKSGKVNLIKIQGEWKIDGLFWNQ
ncbi:MAG: hypothetical protein GW939_00280 [Candidatus Magasanikbacteria bacterium]|uniref:Uncharacterized protein n=1 Tax=Candidatus Magasanikbacteria bacterium CG10_big_fil_rev_8_21_14_0_10_38_6 TaxID=1974647 RepID=A0A2M6P028_9BACT|nr:hypothetical protein [Candidatus Magasanikbacteria bacterium]PIR76899.1 MAG: hypothetical protein COU30_05345 [Candidatus Magasanikbacteria bacterium CG10_big_fil_rev_8_21_14_0_10_38_6]